VSAVAVIGAGWAGLAAAVELVDRGHAVTLFEMARRPGGRARSVAPDGDAAPLDNGQHILIGAYVQTLALMRRVGVDPAAVLRRSPLVLCRPDGSGLRLPPGPAAPAFVRGVLACRHWPLGDRVALLRTAAGWARRGFDCGPALSVAELCGRLPAPIRAELIDPLCIAALNTPAPEASAQVFLRVLRDGLFGGAGGADLLLPRAPLSTLLPEPAAQWLARAGASLRFGHHVTSLEHAGDDWRVDGERFTRVIVATGAAHAARLTRESAPDWSAAASGVRHEPIATVYLRADRARLAVPMLRLADGPQAPAQFVFDHGALGGPAGRLACVVSGASAWLARGRETLASAAIDQLRSELPASSLPTLPQVEQVLVEKRATFRCTPGLVRPSALIRPGLMAAGDHVEGPYPATLEGAVRSGLAAARRV
jgi:squalene-associated FAD-dependent desaturase